MPHPKITNEMINDAGRIIYNTPTLNGLQRDTIRTALQTALAHLKEETGNRRTEWWCTTKQQQATIEDCHVFKETYEGAAEGHEQCGWITV